MLKLLRKISRYITAALTGRFNELADPKVQLEQAIIEAQEQHRRLTEQAANVIANQKQTEMRLNRAMEALEKVSASTRQAVVMADEATSRGDTAKAAEYTRAAESFAGRLIAAEKEVEGLKELSLQSAQASDQAKKAVAQNSSALQKRLSERQKLLSQLDQAKMQEQMNRAMATLSQAVGQVVPDRRGTDAGGRAGVHGRRGPGPPQPDPFAARHRWRECPGDRGAPPGANRVGDRGGFRSRVRRRTTCALAEPSAPPFVG
jgi:phage shock protein A